MLILFGTEAPDPEGQCEFCFVFFWSVPGELGADRTMGIRDT